MPTQKEIDIYEDLRLKITSVRDTIKTLSLKNRMRILICLKFGALI